MKKYAAILGGAIILTLIVFSMGSWAVGQDSESSSGIPVSLTSTPTVFSARAQQAGNGEIGAAQDELDRWVCFFPQDGTTTATALTLYNTTGITAEALLAVSRTDGTFDTASLTFAPWGIIRICSDNVVGEAGWNWFDFGSKVLLGELQLPPGVVVGGFVAWNGTDDTYDPGASVPRLPLQFLDEL